MMTAEEGVPVGRRNYAIDVAAILFGIGAWIAINGVWTELPILVSKLPEGWNLPSIMSLTCQVANVGVVVYSLLNKLWGRRITPTVAILPLMTVGVLACLLLANVWMDTTWVNGQLHSLAFFILVFFLALVDCTSSVTYLPFMATFHKKYLVSYFVGEGLSGLVPALVALGQGVGGNADCVMSYNNTTGITTLGQVTPAPNFSAEIFFYVLSVLCAISFAAFLFLRFHPYARREHLKQAPSSSGSEKSSIRNSINKSERYGTHAGAIEATQQVTDYDQLDAMPASTFVLLLILQTWISFLQNGVMSSVQSYICLPYGNVAYHLSVTLSNVASPLASLIVFVMPNLSRTGLVISTTVFTAVASFMLTMAVLSPTPPLVGSKGGTAMVVVTWIVYGALAGHTKTSLGVKLRTKGARALFWCGAVNQLGSFIGAIIMYVLVDVEYYFHSNDPCDAMRKAMSTTTYSVSWTGVTPSQQLYEQIL